MYRTVIFDFDYRDHFADWGYTFEREQMIATVNILCGNLTLDCASAALDIGHSISRNGGK